MSEMADAQTIPSIAMYDVWREKRVQRFSSGVDRMRERLRQLQDARDEVVAPNSDWAPSGGGFPTSAVSSGKNKSGTSLAAACRTIIYKLVDVAALTGELNAANRTVDEINKMAQSQLTDAALAMRRMKTHVEELARSKAAYEQQIEVMGGKLVRAQEEAQKLRSAAGGGKAVSVVELQAARDEVAFLKNKIRTTEANCKKVLSRLGVAGNEKAPIERHKNEVAAKQVHVGERPLTAPGRVRLPPIAGATPATALDEVQDTSRHADPRVEDAANRVISNLHDAAPPSENETIEYGERNLGLVLPEDNEFVWIAEEALCAPLPVGWSEHIREEDHAVYYYNVHTQESSWNHPMDGYYKTLLESLKELKRELKLVQLSSKSLFAVSQIGSKANAIMKAHNEKLASLLLEENPDSRLKPAHAS